MKPLTPAQVVVAGAMSEAELQRVICEALASLGWIYFHDNDSRRNRAGLPDIIAACKGRVIMAELKSEKGKPRPEQIRWMMNLPSEVGYLWRPSHWLSGAVLDVLR